MGNFKVLVVESMWKILLEKGDGNRKSGLVGRVIDLRADWARKGFHEGRYQI